MQRMAEALNLKVSELLSEYLEMDEDGDFVFKSSPCPMLLEDNRCKIYESRPEACRDYPHSNRKNMKHYWDILEPNLRICPALRSIVLLIDTD
ncbi:MAG: YkgJ family cysteine cluster protein [Bacteroidota bacterium]|nr:YkgJ family cysteine cluster protein [Bacteroidota bacterium]MDX5430872.1 YkgJ family cysteine cluster protein [Bacteroidota bacterium]